MVLDHVHITLVPERAEAYLKAFGTARPQVQGQPGGHSYRLLPKVGAPGELLLVIEWKSKAHHTEGFRRSAACHEWSRLLHPFNEVRPAVEYYHL